MRGIGAGRDGRRLPRVRGKNVRGWRDEEAFGKLLTAKWPQKMGKLSEVSMFRTGKLTFLINIHKSHFRKRSPANLRTVTAQFDKPAMFVSELKYLYTFREYAFIFYGNIIHYTIVRKHPAPKTNIHFDIFF